MSQLLKEIHLAEQNAILYAKGLADQCSKATMMELTTTWIFHSKPQPRQAQWCQRMFELERLYGIHSISPKK